jgi:hypothetical protein
VHSKALRHGGPDLLGCLEVSLGDTTCQLLEPGAHALQRLGALAALKCVAFFGVHDEDPHAGLLGCDLLNQSLGWRQLLARRDAEVDPTLIDLNAANVSAASSILSSTGSPISVMATWAIS